MMVLILTSWKRRMKQYKAYRKYRACHHAADVICRIGFSNAGAQKYLDRAKDDLYAAAIAFKKQEQG